MSSLQTLPKGDSAWLLRRAIERIMQQISVLETNIGSSTTGNSNDTEIIFNDAGTLRGDKDFAWNKTSNILTVDGSATITGDLTVRTDKLAVTSTGVGAGTATPACPLEVYKNTNGQNRLFLNNPSTGTGAYDSIDFTAGTASNQILSMGSGYTGSFPYLTGALLLRSGQANGIVINTGGSAAAIQFGINDTLGMTLNSTGLGVGGSPSYKLSAVGTTNNQVVLHVGNTAGSSDGDTTNVVRFAAGSGANALWANARYDGFSHAWRCNSTTTEAMVLNSSGNVGIGVTPSVQTAGFRALEINSKGNGLLSYSNDNVFLNENTYFDGAWKYATVARAAQYAIFQGSHRWYYDTGTQAVGTNINSVQAMTLDASGNLLVNTTSQVLSAKVSLQTAGTRGYSYNDSTGGAGTKAIIFGSLGVEVGSVSTTTASTTYNTLSDYRLKEAVQPLVGGLARVSALKPSIYKWKSNGSSGEGFLAHELAEVVPAAVTGEKDAVNEDGTVNPQGVDMSRIVPILVAAIQELAARVQTLEAK